MSITAAQSARREAALDRRTRLDDGRIVTRRQLVELRQSEDGAIVYVRDGERRFGPPDRDYWYTAAEVTKTAIDYAAEGQCCEPTMHGDKWSTELGGYTPIKLEHHCGMV